MEIIYIWCQDALAIDAERRTGLSHSTVINWFDYCREVPVKMFSRRGKMGASGKPLQVDESLLRGKRKANRGRLLGADRKAPRVHLTAEDHHIINATPATKRNHGKRMAGPWVLGIVEPLGSSIVEKRFFIVQKRDRPTLHGIIRNEVMSGCEIHSDEWLAYRTLEQYGFLHGTVNHSIQFVDPNTGVHTQLVENSWIGLKLKIVKMMRGTTPGMLERHLIEAWWKSINRPEGRLRQ
ncbi:hypothetical protein B566_EDAN014963 [Ephemera danica]|nr:hypothetical protein B566_EDAN014963 [Ephemera danica]